MNDDIKSDQPVDGYIWIPVALILSFIIFAVGYSVGLPSPSDKATAMLSSFTGDTLTILSVIVGVLAILTTTVLGSAALFAYLTIRRVQQEADQAHTTLREARLKYEELEEYLKNYEEPQEILDKAKLFAEREIDNHITSVRYRIADIDNKYDEIIDKVVNQENNNEKKIDKCIAELNWVKSDTLTKMSESEVRVLLSEEMEKPDKLENMILQKIKVAFLAIKNLNQDERNEIISLLETTKTEMEMDN